MHALARQIRISPKKANVVAGIVRKKSVSQALDILKFTPKKAAPILAKVIQSAASNAENNFKQDREKLYIEEIIIGQGPTYKRSIPVSRGRAYPRRKPTAHIYVRVGVKTEKVALGKEHIDSGKTLKTRKMQRKSENNITS